MTCSDDLFAEEDHEYQRDLDEWGAYQERQSLGRKLYTPTCATPNMQEVTRDLAVLARREAGLMRQRRFHRSCV